MDVERLLDVVMRIAKTLESTDLFVKLEREFRRKSRRCAKCGFSLPYRVFSATPDKANWSVIPSQACSRHCRSILEDLVAKYQAAYRLSESGRFHLARP